MIVPASSLRPLCNVTPDAAPLARSILDAAVSENELAALRLQGADHRLDDRVRAAPSDHHAEALVGHGFEIGEQRAPRDVRREIEMQAPGGHHRLDFRMLESRVEKVARGSQQQLHGVVKPVRAHGPPRLPHDPGGRDRGHGRTQEREDVGRILAEPSEQIPPGFRVRRREGGNACERCLQRPADAEIRPVAKYGREACSAGTKARPCARSASLWAAKKPEPANIERFIAQRSCRKPGSVRSRVLTAPPGSSFASTMATRFPLAARCTPAARPLWPAPMMTAS